MTQNTESSHPIFNIHPTEGVSELFVLISSTQPSGMPIGDCHAVRQLFEYLKADDAAKDESIEWSLYTATTGRANTVYMLHRPNTSPLIIGDRGSFRGGRTGKSWKDHP